MEDIQKVITEIEMKVAKMRSSLRSVNAENTKLQAEVLRLNEKLSARETEVLEFKSKYDQLKAHQEQNHVEQDYQQDKNVQIDALVREIDDCISRLKA
ncbi:hypothetical protein CW751_08495 [Brumimicrobium salinarum]|uniref:Cell division protein ZapB n=1 Tax=Brumimicrobium salinarum TaxID=2058658 RepID=A0A2I0R2K3_9FLAO|nr:hypothetical protein [Brumimicrobium salinarum]PKR80797.1 hypothetical protein CW751_08495 [Brumimicrobium salinarum]